MKSQKALAIPVLAFLAGLFVIAWIGLTASSPLARAMSALIGLVYLIGALEIRRFHLDTHALRRALEALREPPADVQPWLAALPASLRHTARQRLAGERAALPGLALTPYLVALLVMLGMLGTFLGMVVTFQGTVLALERSADLQAMRAALAAPIKGLGLSFGTSIAGVAGSAMLGLLAALVRRERLAASRLLDARLDTLLRPFSHAHQREAAYQALEQQARSLPAVVDGLQALVERLDRRSEQQHEQLQERQARFHQDTGTAYTQLAQAVEASLKDALAAGARAAGDSLRPVVEAAMDGIAQDAARQHERAAGALQGQLEGLSARLAGTARSVAEGWTAAQQQQASTQAALFAGLERALAGFTERFEQRSAQWLEDTGQALAHSARQAAQLQHEQARQGLEQIAQLQASTEALARSRIEAETRWIERHDQRLDALATLWRGTLAELREDEAARGQAAVQRLATLQAEVADHLSRLGTALEAPLERLLRSAAEAPQAAADVIVQLRQEMGRMAERDQQALQERTELLGQLQALLPALNQATQAQRAAIESLVDAATRTLERQAGRAQDLAAGVAQGAEGLARLGEDFGRGIEQFGASSARLSEHLARVEAALAQSMARSDEQLAYYVAQAREVIDLSLSAQQSIVEDLRRLRSQPPPPAPRLEQAASA